LRQYFEYWIMFNRIDTDHDRRLTFEEFQVALHEIEAWGVQVDDVEGAFAEMDEDGHGMILFDEFSNWAIAKQLDLEDDDDGNEQQVALKVQEKYDASRNIAREHEKNRGRKTPKRKSKSNSPRTPNRPSRTSSPGKQIRSKTPSKSNRKTVVASRKSQRVPDDVWARLESKLPWQKNTGGQETPQANVQFL
jgi:hypothetical protein